MAEITPFPTPKLIAEQKAEIARLTAELREARVEASAAKGLNALTRMQLHEVLTTVESWRRDLGDLEANVRSLMLRLPEDGK